MDSMHSVFESLTLPNKDLPEGEVQTIAYIISSCIVGLTVLLFMYCCVSVKKKVQRRSSNISATSSTTSQPGPSQHIRKRDKVANLTKKMFKRLPKAKSLAEIQKILERRGTTTLETAKKLMLGEPESKPGRINPGPPSSALEASIVDHDYRLPPELKNLLQSVRVFGNFEQPVFLELCKFVSNTFHPRGSLLKDLDHSFYVCQSGELSVFIEDSEQKQYIIKRAYQGESIFSLLSILDIISGNTITRRSNVYARCDTDCYLLKLPTRVFSTIHSKSPESMFRFVQVIMLRLSRVTYLALYKYLGLTKELVDKDISLPDLNIHCLSSYKRSKSGKIRRSIDVPSLQCRSPSLHSVVPPLPSFPHSLHHSRSRRSLHSLHPSRSRRSYSLPRRTRSRSNTNNSASGVSGDEHYEEAQVFNMDNPVSPEKADVTLTDPAHTDPAHTDSATPADSADHLANTDVIDDSNIIKIAVEDLVTILELPDSTALEGKVTLVHIARGSVICKQGDVEKMLTFVVSGFLEVTQHDVHDDQQTFLYNTKIGELIGILSVLTGDPSQVTVTAPKRAILLTISRFDVIKLIREYPACLMKLAQELSKRISLFVHQMDYALEWCSLESGHALYRQGEPSHSTYIVLSGRLRSVLEHDNGKKELISEFGRGDTIGVIEFATGTSRTMTVLAVRDTELGKIPEGLLNTIKLQHPKTVSRLIHLLGHQILGQYKQRPSFKHQMSVGTSNTNIHTTPNTNLATVALLPASRQVPLGAFAAALSAAISTIGPCKRLTSSIILKQLGNDALNSVYECQLTNHLNSIEDQNRIVLYQADSVMSPWTRQCIRQADIVMIIALANHNPEECGPIEVSLNSMSVRAQKELILLHPAHTKEPVDTVRWLNARGWISSHLHVRCPDYIFQDKASPHPEDFNPHSDLARVARRLTGTSIGVVLGGGGARGIAHVGILQALEDHGIPVDMIGGTSIGSFMGALYADETNVANMRERAEHYSHDMSKMWKKILDLTYPFTSMFSGYGFNGGIHTTFSEKSIEDLWIPYFAVTTDLTNSEMRIHTQGCLWRYVRASMTLSGYLPPMCDPVDGHLLVDGGYVNNLPADIMSQRMGAQTIIAVDVGGQSDNDFENYGDALSGWWVLWNRYFPFGRSLKIPNMAEIQTRLAYVSCERQLALVSGMENCYYIRPPIDRFATLQFGSFEEIEETGYKYGTGVVSAWVKGGVVLSDMLADHRPGINRVTTQTKSFVNYPSYESDQDDEYKIRAPSPYASFTDIATMVSRIETPKHEEEPRPRHHFNRQFSWPSGALGDYSDSDSSESSTDEPFTTFSHMGNCPGFYSDGDIPPDTHPDTKESTAGAQMGESI